MKTKETKQCIAQFDVLSLAFSGMYLVYEIYSTSFNILELLNVFSLYNIFNSSNILELLSVFSLCNICKLSNILEETLEASQGSWNSII